MISFATWALCVSGWVAYLIGMYVGAAKKVTFRSCIVCVFVWFLAVMAYFVLLDVYLLRSDRVKRCVVRRLVDKGYTLVHISVFQKAKTEKGEKNGKSNQP